MIWQRDPARLAQVRRDGQRPRRITNGPNGSRTARTKSGSRSSPIWCVTLLYIFEFMQIAAQCVYEVRPRVYEVRPLAA